VFEKKTDLEKKVSWKKSQLVEKVSWKNLQLEKKVTWKIFSNSLFVPTETFSNSLSFSKRGAPVLYIVVSNIVLTPGLLQNNVKKV